MQQPENRFLDAAIPLMRATTIVMGVDDGHRSIEDAYRIEEEEEEEVATFGEEDAQHQQQQQRNGRHPMDPIANDAFEPDCLMILILEMLAFWELVRPELEQLWNAYKSRKTTATAAAAATTTTKEQQLLSAHKRCSILRIYFVVQLIVLFVGFPCLCYLLMSCLPPAAALTKFILDANPAIAMMMRGRSSSSATPPN